MKESAEESMELQQMSALSLKKQNSLQSNKSHQFIQLLHDKKQPKIQLLQQLYKENQNLVFQSMDEIVQSFKKLDQQKKKVIKQNLQKYSKITKTYFDSHVNPQFDFNVWQFYLCLLSNLCNDQVINNGNQAIKINQQESLNSCWEQKGKPFFESIYDGSTCQTLITCLLALLFGASFIAGFQIVQIIMFGITLVYIIIGGIFFCCCKRRQNRGRIINMSQRIEPQ